jgi:hypothetical protein
MNEVHAPRAHDAAQGKYRRWIPRAPHTDGERRDTGALRFAQQPAVRLPGDQYGGAVLTKPARLGDDSDFLPTEAD